MNPPPIQDELQLGVQHHRAGRLAEAEMIYRRVLVRRPDHFDPLHLLGVLLMQTGQPAAAIECLEKAVAIQPLSPDAYNNLGLAQMRAGRLKDAIDSLRKSLALKLDLAEAHANLGEALLRQGKVDQSITCIRQALTLNPGIAQAHNHLGSALRLQGQFAQAAEAHRQAISLDPHYAEAHLNLGNTLCDQRRFDLAVAAYRAALKINPNYIAAWNYLGMALADLGQYNPAIEAFRQAIARSPDFAQAHHNLGQALRHLGQLDDAAAAYRTAARLDPTMIQVHNSLGVVLQDLGELQRAIDCFSQALSIDPNQPAVHSNLLFTQQCIFGSDAELIFQEHRKWNQHHAQPLASRIRPHSRDRNPDRRLRIGYVSADFRDHAVMRFFRPLLEHHDHKSFEIHCYANVINPDATTAGLQKRANVWRDIAAMDDEHAAELVRNDQIDLLVDLAGHTSGNRLPLFASKPAPIQLTWLGYPGTTGMSAIDYRITDELSDPIGQTEAFHSEKLIRLPQTAWCYSSGETPEVGPTASQRGGRVTFGCFNNLSKLTEPMLRVWAKILRLAPHTGLLLKAVGLSSASARSRILRVLSEEQIDPQRIILHGWTPTHASHMALYHQVDIALDTFPYNGTTTTCDALWMGVPVVSLTGPTHVSRVGLSLLNSVGLADLSAGNEEDYIRIAIDLAHDLDRLNDLRSTLRRTMQSSPLMDAARFASDMESAYRALWREWCGKSI